MRVIINTTCTCCFAIATLFGTSFIRRDTVKSMMTPIAITARAALGLTARRSIRPAVQCVCPSHPSVVVDGVHRYQSSGITKASSFQKKALEVLRSQSDANGKSDKPSEGMGIKVKKPLKKKSFFGAVSDSDQSVSDAASPKTDDTTAKDLDKPEIEKPTPEAIAPPAPPKEQNRRLSSEFLHEFAPKIVVLGVGGAGGNALNNMVAKELQGVEFVALNTDAQHLASTLTDQRIQLGAELTRGLGCGANPDAGRLAAEESREQIQEQLKDAHLVFITAGMGGGTGTGAAPVIADICYEMGILTVGVVTLPFSFEGSHRKRLALEGIERIQNVVDTLIVIPNQNLFQIAGPETTFVDAFQMADDVLLGGVKSITDLMTSPGLINLDFADVQVSLRLLALFSCVLHRSFFTV